jgi:uncharacterized membrane protein YeaQ/YmgE (transglycosylase-associated protein family)
MNLTAITSLSTRRWQLAAAALGIALCGFGLRGLAQAQTSAPAVGDRLTAADKEAAKSKIQETGQVALNKIEVMWQRIDEHRLKNRTPDELVAWVIMGLLVGGVLFRFGKSGQVMSIVMGLFGSFIGGIVAHVLQLDFGLGPLLIRYEDLLCTLVGGLLMLCGLRWAVIMKLFKPKVP